MPARVWCGSRPLFNGLKTNWKPCIWHQYPLARVCQPTDCVLPADLLLFCSDVTMPKQPCGSQQKQPKVERQSEPPKDCGKFDPEKPEALVGLHTDVLALLVRAAQVGICAENEDRAERLKAQLGDDFYYRNGAWVKDRCKEKLLSKPVGPHKHCYPERQWLRAVSFNMQTKHWIRRRSLLNSDTDSETEIQSHARTQR